MEMIALAYWVPLGAMLAFSLGIHLLDRRRAAPPAAGAPGVVEAAAESVPADPAPEDVAPLPHHALRVRCPSCGLRLRPSVAERHALDCQSPLLAELP